MKGHLQQRGPDSWRLKFDAGRDPGTGKRVIRYVTFRGTKREAQIEMARLITEATGGNSLEPTKLTLAAYLDLWADALDAAVSPKTAERYRQLIARQIVPHIGAVVLQRLRPTHIATWHATLLRSGRHDGSALGAQTVGSAHRVLHKALEDAIDREILTKNPAGRISPPKVNTREVLILSADQVKTVLSAIAESAIFPHVMLLLATGMRRGELMGLQWGDVDLDAGSLRVERSLEITNTHGLRIKPPKTKSGRRQITLPPSAIQALVEHRRAQLEIRVKLGIGKLQRQHHVFGEPDGSPRNPDLITHQWRYLVSAKGLPAVTLHALRHSHASALIAAGQDVVTVSRRLGHGNPTITLSVYAHLFDKTDEASAKAIEAVLKPTENKS